MNTKIIQQDNEKSTPSLAEGYKLLKKHDCHFFKLRPSKHADLLKGQSWKRGKCAKRALLEDDKQAVEQQPKREPVQHSLF